MSRIRNALVRTSRTFRRMINAANMCPRLSVALRRAVGAGVARRGQD
jgi:hypothetical protein